LRQRASPRPRPVPAQTDDTAGSALDPRSIVWQACERLQSIPRETARPVWSAPAEARGGPTLSIRRVESRRLTTLSVSRTLPGRLIRWLQCRSACPRLRSIARAVLRQQIRAVKRLPGLIRGPVRPRRRLFQGDPAAGRPLSADDVRQPWTCLALWCRCVVTLPATLLVRRSCNPGHFGGPRRLGRLLLHRTGCR